MGKETLVDTLIGEGRIIVESLDKEGIAIACAFWFYLSSEAIWRLKLASKHPDFATPSRILKGYQRIVDTMSNSQVTSISIADIEIVSLKDPLVLALKKAGKVSGMGAIHLQNTLVSDIFFEDAYIYRVDNP